MVKVTLVRIPHRLPLLWVFVISGAWGLSAVGWSHQSGPIRAQESRTHLPSRSLLIPFRSSQSSDIYSDCKQCSWSGVRGTTLKLFWNKIFISMLLQGVTVSSSSCCPIWLLILLPVLVLQRSENSGEIWRACAPHPFLQNGIFLVVKTRKNVLP